MESSVMTSTKLMILERILIIDHEFDKDHVVPSIFIETQGSLIKSWNKRDVNICEKQFHQKNVMK